MTRGIIFAIIYIITTIVVPYLGFTWIKNLTIQGFEIQIEQTQYETIIFWIFAFGLIISGCAFFSYSSPPQSIRRGVFSLIQIILNCFYIWSYRFSGALTVEFVIVDYGILYLDLQQMILVYLGVYFLTILLKVYDVVDFTINRFKIREEKEQKLLQKEVR
ncbi:MAG: hypothetical protein ACFFBP_03690 [Promethearchaeota archaeon]